MLAPVCLFVWKRYDHLVRTLSALKSNYLARETELYVCSNAAISEEEKDSVEKIRSYVSAFEGMKKTTLICNEINKGISENLIKNVTKILKIYGKIIVLEDDMITSPNFLDFMNQALNFYQGFDNIQQIAGYCIPFDIKSTYDTYFIPRSCSWSWATWKDKWDRINWTPDKSQLLSVDWKRFCSAGEDMKVMLKALANGTLNTWDITSDYSIYMNHMLTVFPTKSFIFNIGMDGTGEHCPKTDRYNSELVQPDKREFVFDKEVAVNPKILRLYSKFYKLSWKSKIYNILSPIKPLVAVWRFMKSYLKVW